tara:strand:+ start:7149 stop:7361 length:213 start_codon:yes stop_codon:yes gene_type:complete
VIVYVPLLTVLMLITVWLAKAFGITEPIYFWPYMAVNTLVNMRVSNRLTHVIADYLSAHDHDYFDENPPK